MLIILDIFIDGEKMENFSIIEVDHLTFELILNFPESFTKSKLVKFFFNEI